ncbi:MAG: hypothetical protein ACI8QT_000145 [Halioglobus sp.]|jgi:uncharacterized protein (TIGR00255 family)
MTIRSMTAFARETLTTEQGDLTVELRSVNHRYLDCTFKLPDALRQMEPKLRESAGEKLSRGKLDCVVRIQINSNTNNSLKIDNGRLHQLLSSAEAIAAKLPESRALSPLEILQFPGVCATEDISYERFISDTLRLFNETITSLASSRKREGEKLAKMVLTRLELIEEELAKTRSVLPKLMAGQRARITSRIAELNIETDESRLEQELVHLAQKADIDEELDRLETHIAEVRRVLKQGGACGRRLDFLMQELNREANTLSSKSQSSNTTMAAVELKVLIEQMREQIQNIE